jgi:LysM repeat protein
MQANNLRNPDFIFVGQRLTIPGGALPGPLRATTYVVQQNDTLFSIATRHGTTVSALMQANGLYNYWIYVGQVLKIPGYASPAPIPQPLPQSVYHIVRSGDYLAAIATRYRSTPYSIQIANKLSNPSFIWTGQKLYIPDGQPPVNPPMASNLLPPIGVPPVINPPLVIASPVPPVGVQPIPVAPPIVVQPPPAPVIPNPYAHAWEAVLITNTIGTGPCSLAAIVVGKNDWPVVVATTDGAWISDPKYTGTKPERGPYVVEFAHACTGVWRVIPLGLNIYADVQLNGGHAEVEFHPRLN